MKCWIATLAAEPPDLRVKIGGQLFDKRWGRIDDTDEFIRLGVALAVFWIE